jgi:phosphohistidine phosphatase
MLNFTTRLELSSKVKGGELMALYLVQHGKALPKDQDPQRRLSDEGHAEVHMIAKLAGKHGVAVSRIEHSTKARAKETAGIFASALNPEGGVGEREGITPNDDVTALKDELAPTDNLMLVGHLPFMERLASYLITGSPEPPVIKFQNSGIVCLDKDPDAANWFIKWTLMPDIK